MLWSSKKTELQATKNTYKLFKKKANNGYHRLKIHELHNLSELSSHSIYIYIYLRHSYRLHTTTCILSEKFQSALKISPTAIRHDIGHNFNLNNWQVYSIDFLHINNIIGAKERSSDIQTPFIYIQNPRGPSIFWDTQWG